MIFTNTDDAIFLDGEMIVEHPYGFWMLRYFSNEKLAQAIHKAMWSLPDNATAENLKNAIIRQYTKEK